MVLQVLLLPPLEYIVLLSEGKSEMMRKLVKEAQKQFLLPSFLS